MGRVQKVLIAFAAGTAALAVSSLAPAGTIYVSACGNDAWTGHSAVCAAPDGPKATVQNGIGVAASGDIVDIAAGSYSGSVIVDKSLTLRATQVGSVTFRNQSGTILTTANGAGGLIPIIRIEGIRFCDGTSGAASLSGGEITFDQCDFENNFAMNGGAVHTTTSTRFANCLFRGNQAGGAFLTHMGGAILAYRSLIVEDCLFESNGGEVLGGAIMSWGPFVRVSRTTFRDNQGFGMLVLLESTDAVIEQCHCLYNTGPAMSLWGAAVVRNCLFVGNHFGAISVIGGTVSIGSCTFHNNSGASPSLRFGGGAGSTAVVGNCIFSGGSAPQFFAGAAGLIVSSCVVQGPGPAAPSITQDVLYDADPRYVDPYNGDYRLRAGSPAIDRGSSLAAGAVSLDLAGVQRPLDGDHIPGALPDLGAHEFNGTPLPPTPAFCAADFNGSGIVDATDIFVFLDLWFAGNGQTCP